MVGGGKEVVGVGELGGRGRGGVPVEGELRRGERGEGDFLGYFCCCGLGAAESLTRVGSNPKPGETLAADVGRHGCEQWVEESCIDAPRWGRSLSHEILELKLGKGGTCRAAYSAVRGELTANLGN